MKHLNPALFSISVLVIATVCRPIGAADPLAITVDHVYGHKAGMALTLDVVQPAKPNGIGLLYLVSRGWVSDYFDLDQAMKVSQQRHGRFAVLVDRGYTLFMVRHGSAPFFKVPDAVSDVRRALRYVRHHADDFRIDPDRIGVFGNSAGGHLALMLGTTPDDGDADADDPIERVVARVAAVVAYYPPVDLRPTGAPSESLRRLQSGPLDLDAESLAAGSPLIHVDAGDAPTLLIHGDQDTTVPLQHSKAMFDALQTVGVESKLIVMPGAGHAFPGDYGQRAASALADWFDHCLRQAK